MARHPSTGACWAPGVASWFRSASAAGPSRADAGTPSSSRTLFGYWTVSLPTSSATSGSNVGTWQIVAGSSVAAAVVAGALDAAGAGGSVAETRGLPPWNTVTTSANEVAATARATAAATTRR